MRRFTERIMIQVTPDTREWLETRAAGKQLRLAEYIRSIIDWHMGAVGPVEEDPENDARTGAATDAERRTP